MPGTQKILSVSDGNEDNEGWNYRQSRRNSENFKMKHILKITQKNHQ